MNVYNGTEIRKVEIALKFGQNALPQRAPNETAISNTQQSLSKQGKKHIFTTLFTKRTVQRLVERWAGVYLGSREEVSVVVRAADSTIGLVSPSSRGSPPAPSSSIAC